MSAPQGLIEQLVRDEGEKLHAYLDSRGYLTIGVGHLIDPQKGGSIPQSISRQLLDYDVQQTRSALFGALPWVATLDPIRQEVLVNMAFNLGVEGLLKFSNTLANIKTGDFSAAAMSMLHSAWATQVPERAARLATQIRTGVRQ